MSSRNRYLSRAERSQAAVVPLLTNEIRARVRAEKSCRVSALKRACLTTLARFPAARLDYIEFFHPDTLEPVSRATRGTHMALAVFVGKTRLIDNGRL